MLNITKFAGKVAVMMRFAGDGDPRRSVETHHFNDIILDSRSTATVYRTSNAAGLIHAPPWPDSLHSGSPRRKPKTSTPRPDIKRDIS